MLVSERIQERVNRINTDADRIIEHGNLLDMLNLENALFDVENKIIDIQMEIHKRSIEESIN